LQRGTAPPEKPVSLEMAVGLVPAVALYLIDKAGKNTPAVTVVLLTLCAAIMLHAAYRSSWIRSNEAKVKRGRMSLAALLVMGSVVAFGVWVWPETNMEQVFLSFGKKDHKCTANIDMPKLRNYKNNYKGLLVCGVWDNTIDRYQDDRIGVSSPFTIGNQPVEIDAPYGLMLKALANQNPDQEAALWFALILLKNGEDPTTVKNLSAVKSHGGMIFER
jgi:hypothetical protein